MFQYLSIFMLMTASPVGDGTYVVGPAKVLHTVSECEAERQVYVMGHPDDLAKCVAVVMARKKPK